MRIFSENEGKYFCKGYINNTGIAEGSINEYYKKKLIYLSFLKEKSAPFSEYRSCSLRNVERCLFLAASNYRRCLDLMMPSASSWSYVTAYYGTWYAAHALLGMFGCAVFKSHIVDVVKSSPGTQELKIRKIGNGIGEESTTYTNSSHKQFWDFFYKAFIPLQLVVPVPLMVAIKPISSNPTWQIDNRNLVNYDSFEAIRLGQDFQTTFIKTTFPASLPGILNTQYGIFEALLELAFYYAKEFEINTDALYGLGGIGNLTNKVRNLVYDRKKHDLLPKTKRDVLLK